MPKPDDASLPAPTLSPHPVQVSEIHSSTEDPPLPGPIHDASLTSHRQTSLPQRINTIAARRPQLPPGHSTFTRLKKRATGGSAGSPQIMWDPHSSDSAFSTSSSSSSEDEGPRPRRKPAGPTRAGTSAGRARKATAAAQLPTEKNYSRFAMGNESLRTRGKVSKHDGRLNMSVNETKNSGYLAKALGTTLSTHLGHARKRDGAEVISKPAPLETVRRERPHMSRTSTASTAVVDDGLPRPKLNIVIMVIGSRGDIQPFLKIGKVLKEEHGHRVRIATHPAFKGFVMKDSGLEFFSVGGDPSELMAFMVKNPGLIPSMATVKAGEIGRRRDQMFEMFQGFWRACINATDDETDVANRRMMSDKHPFVADAIIANPPSFAHVHCAERLGIPLHLMFTFPYSPTQAFPHPLANIKKSNLDANYTNFMSYPLVEMMTWQGLGDLINRFRVKTLQLEPVSTLWAPGQLYRLKVPYTYLWSPGLVPKPADWGPEIDIAGFVFLDLASSFEPPQSLRDFLDAGPPPVYIGFGSIVVDDADRFTAMIFEAVAKAGVRALVSKGWGGLGGDDPPDNIYMLENTPHDWLFPRVSAVVHHGGAGTTAIGLKCGKPTMVVPFFGDQPFWGDMIARSGAGAHEAVPYKRLDVERLAEGIRECLTPEARDNAAKLADDIAGEGDGARNAVETFHGSLPLRGERSMRCAILEDRLAVWSLKKTGLRLSALAAEILVEERKITRRNLRLLRHCEWNDFDGPGEPFTGGGAALVGSVASMAKGLGSVPVQMAKSVKRHERREAKRRQKADVKTGEAARETMRHRAREGDQPGTVAGQSAAHQHKLPRPEPEHNGHAKGSEHEAAAADGDAERDDDDENIVQDLANDAGKGFEKSGQAIAKAPMDLFLAVAQGFHNAPRLYGDATVRTPHRISGFHSGMRAAGEEFVYGIYDGVTGLVVHPYTGARDEGFVGFVTGVGKGVGGFVLKDIAAIVGPFGYTLKGIHKELQKGRQPTHFIRRARSMQGGKDLRQLDEGARRVTVRQVEEGWQVVLELGTLGEDRKAQGIRGKLQHRREKKRWREHGALENVGQARRALEAKKRGEDFDVVFALQREELRRAGGPTKSTTETGPKGAGGVNDEEGKPTTESAAVETDGKAT
ncbi:MAG: hypothetical protein M1832_002618 [Thelocarpon impressellum]|nr:MAG: hypothetical protein M1832_002618 [Thelocarpon impressellum]